MQKNHYDVLQIPRTASADDIKRGYRKMSSKLHPDKNPGTDTTAAMQEINAAYAELSDPSKRAAYDSMAGFYSRSDEIYDAIDELNAKLDAMLYKSLLAEFGLAAAEDYLARRARDEVSVAHENAKRAAVQREQAEAAARSAKMREEVRAEFKAEEAAKRKAKKQAKQQETLEALRAEVRKLCSIPPASLSSAGVMATREWKATAARLYPFATNPESSIEVLNSIRESMIEAAAAVGV